MGPQGIFLIRDGKLGLLEQRRYDSETILQEALASYPEVLAGSSTTDSNMSPRLLLIRREMGVPAAAGAGATWSLDHLFISGEGVPVLVEVKRSSDTRLRREVVGQMLDYAANAVRYWPPADLRAALEATSLAEGTTADERLREVVADMEPDQFWQQVEENLRAGRIRMVFVADRLPAELVRVIEFLNEQMSPAEVLGVEVVQYVGADHQVLVPRLVGRTSHAVATKQSGRTSWDEEGFLTAVADRHGEDEAAFFNRLFDHVRSHAGHFAWSSQVTARYPIGGEATAVWTADPGVGSPKARAYVTVYLPAIRNRTVSDTFDAFVAGLEAIPSYSTKIAEARADDFTRYPALFVSDLVAAGAQVDHFFATLDQLLAASSASGGDPVAVSSLGGPDQ